MSARKYKFRSWNKITKQFDHLFKLSNNGIEPINGQHEISQYIGYNDDNGKEIYEGDILRCYSRIVSSHLCVVSYREKEVRYFFDFIQDYREHDPLDVPTEDKHWEVVGNIFENPERCA